MLECFSEGAPEALLGPPLPPFLATGSTLMAPLWCQLPSFAFGALDAEISFLPAQCGLCSCLLLPLELWTQRFHFCQLNVACAAASGGSDHTTLVGWTAKSALTTVDEGR